MALFSQYLAKVNIPAYSRKNGGCTVKGGYPLFRLFPVSKLTYTSKMFAVH